ncbi:MAG: hypothetical protein HZB54_07570 [Deltaproteobacteria bacterium]|nr:hypothetical protein [Deltaproteobacteria bacterium]
MALTAWRITFVQAEEKAGRVQKSWNFEDIPIGQVPAGWKIDATDPKGRLAEWGVITDHGAPSSPHVLSITKINDTFGGVFNLCWTSDILFKDGVIESKVRANSGEEDQGGGVIWRAKDANNYYLARYNPLERNFRLYYVKDGARKILADSAKLGVKTGEWFTIRIIHRDDKIEGWLNEKKSFEVTDRTFMNPGGVGFWTKADAATSFDDLSISK